VIPARNDLAAPTHVQAQWLLVGLQLRAGFWQDAPGPRLSYI